jgi:dipeptidyl aminopeptidase/acylaminoacyl peptidase
MSPVLSLRPERALADEVLEIDARGFEPGARVTLTAVSALERGTYRGEATFVADDGVVDPGTAAPVDGDYEGVRPMGLFQFASEVDAAVDPPTTRVTAAVDGEVVATATCERRAEAAGVETVSVDHDDLVGELLVPPGDGPHPGVVLLGGSGGGTPTGPRASLLASRGYAVLALAYFDASGLPDELVEVPLAYFDRAVAWLTDRDAVRAAPLGVLGVSRGSEAAIQLAARSDAVRTVVAVAPAAHRFQGLSRDLSGGTSAWSEDGDPTPYVPLRWGWTDTLKLVVNVLLGRPNEVAMAYAGGLADADEATREAAALPVADVGGPVLLVSGDEDALWPSTAFGDRLLGRLDDADHPHPADHVVTEGAGHAISVPYLPVGDRTVGGDGRLRFRLGGSPAAYARADAETWPRILRTLAEGLRVDSGRDVATEE